MAVIELGDQNMDFAAREILGLVMSESYGGCSMVVLSPNPIKVGERYSVRVGHQGSVLGEVRWIHSIESGIMKVGFSFQV